MKKVLLIITLTLWSTFLFAGKGGPDTYGYTWIDSDEPNGPKFSWLNVKAFASEVQGLGDDNIVGPFSISNFDYYWYQPSQFYVGSNGYISFGNVNIAATGSGFPTIPTANGLNDLIAPFMTDLNFAGVNNPGKVYVWNDPNSDTVCISYENVPFWNAATNFAGSNSFQIILNKGDSSITFNYLSQTGTINQPPPQNYLSAGIENITGTIGLQAILNAYPKDSFTVRFEYPKVVTYRATDAGLGWIGNDKSGGIFTVSGGSPVALSSNVRNYGNQLLTSFNVDADVETLSGTNLVSTTQAISSLSAGDDTTVTFNRTFIPSVPGTYRFISGSSGIANDLVPGNDSREQEIIAVDISQSIITLDYSDGFPNGTGISWNGGNGGIGAYFEPPFYPAEITSTKFLLQAVGSGFTAMVYDDDGVNGTPGTLLDSVNVPIASINTTGYTFVTPASTTITIPSGGFYLLWYMNGTGAQLARDTDPPISGRMYEVLSGIWAEYRDKQTEDFLMGVELMQPTIEDLSPILMVSPRDGGWINGNTDVEVTIKNQGNVLVAPGFNVGYQIDGGNVVKEPFNLGPISPSGVVNFKFAQQIIPPAGGQLKVWTELSNDAEPANDTIIANLAPVGVPQITGEAKRLSIAPNPNKGAFNLILPELSGPYKVSVTDVHGKLVYSGALRLKPYLKQMEFSFTSLPAGIYNMTLSQEATILNARFIKSE